MANTDNIAKPTRLPWIQGNQIELALPLQIVYFTENGKYIQDYIPQQGDVIKVLLESKCHCYEYTPTVEDGNVLHITDDGQLCVGTYSVTVAITNTTSGKKHRSKWNYVIDVYDDNAKVVDEFDDFPDWGDGAIIDNSVFYFVGTKDVEYITVDTIDQLPQEGVIGNIYRVANYDGTQVNPNAYAEYDWNGTQYKLLDVKNYGIDEKPTNGSTNLVESGGTKSLLDEKANKNGYYETLGAGTATNLRAIDAHDNTFKYRKTGGTQSIVSGTASIESIKGNTLVWNQYVKINSTSTSVTQNNVTWVDNRDGSYTFSTTAEGASAQTNFAIDSHLFDSGFVPVGHKLYIGGYSGGSSRTWRIYDSYSGNIGSLVAYDGGIVTPSANTRFTINCRIFANAVITTPVTIRPMCIDLTLIYGEGNEPSTPEQFEADYFRWFGKPLTYEPYDAGSLRNVQMQGLKTTGFNQWDEEWEVGTISNDGTETTTANGVKSSNFCKCLSQTSYYVTYPSDTTKVLYICWYDSNKTYIKRYSIVRGGSSIMSPSNACYFKISIGGYGEYDNEFCINISAPNKNGTYEPYEEHNVSVPVTTITGKVNGQGESVVIFPDGMKGVGDVKDEIKVENGVTKAIKRIGRVDLGSLTSWGKSSISTYAFYATGLRGIVKNQTNNLLSYIFVVGSLSGDASGIIEIDSVGTIYAALSPHTSSSTFKAAMQGVMLDYELAEPIEYVVDDFGLPINYKAINGGTEEIIDVDNTIGISPTTLIRYSIDAAKTITNLPIDYQSQDSMANLLNALGAAMGGTWTTTFDTTTNRYTYSFTPNT